MIQIFRIKFNKCLNLINSVKRFISYNFCCTSIFSISNYNKIKYKIDFSQFVGILKINMLNKVYKKIFHYVNQFIKPVNITKFIILLSCFFILYIITSPSNTKEIAYLIATANQTHAVNIEDNLEDQSLCYKNFVWNENNEYLKFKNIFDDNELEKSNGKNMFFHITDCIHDGIPLLNPRLIIIFI